ncbi:MAG: IucA/IucC family protein, partial [Bacteriovoracia bacterium]
MNLRLPILSLAFGLSLPTAFAYPPWIRPAYEGLIRYEQNYVFRINNPDYFHSIGGRSVGLPSRYFPENKPEFKLLTVELPVDEALIYGFDEIPAELKVTRGGKSYVKFLIHPESRDLYIDLIKKYGAKEEYTATSLSSYRSLVIWKADQPGSELMVKLSLNRKIGGVVRNLEGEWIQRANGASALVHTINPETLEQMGIGMIDEPASITPSEINGGMQIRRWPTDSPAKRRLIPMFSLGATTPVNTRLSQASPLLEEYIKRSGLSAQQFIEKHIIAPVTRQLAYLAV